MASDDEDRRDRGDRPEFAFVLLAFVAAAAAAVWYVAHFGRNVPYMEDWELVPVLSGRRPASLDWLFEQLLEHRYVLPKAVIFATWRLTSDFRGTMFLDLALVIAIAAAFTLASRRVRGRWSYADAFFPIAFLHFGHYENLIFSSQVYYVLPIALFATAVVVVLFGAWETRVGAILFGAAVVLLPLNGGIGLLLAPPLVAWAAYATAARARAASGVPWVLAASAAISVLVSALYCVNFHRLTQPGAIPRTFRTILRTTLQTFSIALGPEGRNLWPAAPILVAGACAAAGVLATYAVVRGEDRTRAAGLLGCLVASSLVLVGIGYGRAQVLDTAGFPSHYAWLAVLPLSCAYFSFVMYGGETVARLVPALLAGAALAMYGAGAHEGLDYGRSLAEAEDGLLADARAGLPPEVIAQRFSPRIYPNREPMAERLGMLRDAGVGPYAGLAPSSRQGGDVYREESIPIAVVDAHEASVEGDFVRGTGSDPFVIVALPRPTRVAAVRLDYDVTNSDGVAPETQVFWSLTGTNEFDASSRNAVVQRDDATRSATIWLFDTVDRLRIDPDIRPCELRLRGVTLLLPAQ